MLTYTYHMSFATRLRTLRTEAGLSQYQLAARSGLARTVIADYEQGRHEPQIECLLKIADALVVSVDSLLGRQVTEQGSALSLDAAMTAAAAQGRDYLEYHGKAYRLRKGAWEPV